MADMKLNEAICRPKNIGCDEIWGLYEMLVTMEEPYVFYRCKKIDPHREELFYVYDVELGDNGIEYGGPDNMGMILPASKYEWVSFSVRNLVNGQTQYDQVTVRVNALYENDWSIRELLEMNNVRLPEKKDMDDIEFKQSRIRIRRSPYNLSDIDVELPVYYYPVGVIKGSKFVIGPGADRTIRDIKDSLKRDNFTYVIKVENGIRKCIYTSMMFSNDNGRIEGCVELYKYAAECKVIFIPEDPDIIRNSSNVNELLIFLNHINSVGWNYLKNNTKINFPKPLVFNPRIYLEENRIVLATLIDYKSWYSSSTYAEVYITKYSWDHMVRLEHLFIDVLSGKKTSSEAISEMRTRA